jgi:hypothetical protein
VTCGNRLVGAALLSQRPPAAVWSGARRQIVKWTGMYLVGFLVLLGGVVAALWKLGVLASIGTTWTLIGIAIAVGIGIMIAVSNSGIKENIEIDRK